MPRSNPKRAKGGRVVRCWAVWWKHANLPTVFFSKHTAVQHFNDLLFPEDYTLTRAEIREVLPRRSKAKP